MHLFINSGQKQPNLKMLNNCWMFLHAFFLSDIVDATGSRIESGCWEVQHACHSESQWPRMHRPLAHAIVVWKWALTTALNLRCNQSLSRPLGPWLPQVQPSGWYYNPSSDSLWQCQNQAWMWRHHSRIPTCLQTKTFHLNGILEPIQPRLQQLEKAQVTVCCDKVILLGQGPILPLPKMLKI